MLTLAARLTAEDDGFSATIRAGEGDLDRLDDAARAAGAGVDRLGDDARSAGAGVDQLGDRARGAGAGVDDLAGKTERGGAVNKGFGGAAQQAGYQIADFAVQVSSGGNVMTAFVQQGSQLLGSFGPWGAVIGAAVAVVGSLAAGLGLMADETARAAEASARLDDAVDAANDTLERHKRLARELATDHERTAAEVAELASFYRSLTDEMRAYETAVLTVQRTSVLREAAAIPAQVQAAAEAIRDVEDSIAGSRRLAASASGNADAARAARDAYDELADAIRAFENAADPTAPEALRALYIRLAEAIGPEGPLSAAAAEGGGLATMRDAAVETLAALAPVVEQSVEMAAQLQAIDAGLAALAASSAAAGQSMAASAAEFQAGMAAIDQVVQAGTGRVVDAFAGMYDTLVGNSIVPDLMEEIEGLFGRLGAIMAQPAQAATGEVVSAFETAEGAVSSALQRVAGNLKRGETSWQSYAGVVIDSVFRVLEALAIAGLNDLFGIGASDTAAAAGSGLTGETYPIVPVVRTPIAHGGGVIGPDGPAGANDNATRVVSLAAIRGAPRMHGGGLLPGEVPIVAKQGEVIGWPEQLRHAFGGGQGIQVNVYDMRRQAAGDGAGGGGAPIGVSEGLGPDGRRQVRIMVYDSLADMAESGKLHPIMTGTYGIRPQGVG